MKIPENRQNIKIAYKFSAIAVCIFYALYFVTVPIQLSVSADVRYMSTLLPQLINFIGKVFEVCGMATVYAIAIYSVYKNGRAAYGKAYLFCSATATVKCLIVQIVSWLVSGGIPTFNNGLTEELLLLVILPTALEILQFTVFFLLAKVKVMRFRRGYEAASAAARVKGIEYPEMDGRVYPFASAFDFKNPVLYGCLMGGVVISASKLLLTAFNEIFMAINGLVIENFGDLAISVASFASDIACGVLAYTVMAFIIIKAFELSAARQSE